MVVPPSALDTPRRTTAPAAAEKFDTWALVELMGHRRVVARVTEQTIAGHGFIRLDEPAVDGHPARTQLVSPGAVYAMHPMTEDLALGVAARWRSEPITQWDLPAPWREAIRNATPATTPAELEAATDRDAWCDVDDREADDLADVLG